MNIFLGVFAVVYSSFNILVLTTRNVRNTQVIPSLLDPGQSISSTLLRSL